MADQKTTQLPEMSIPDLGDLAKTVDDPGGTPTSKKVTWERVLGQLGYDVPGGRLTLESGVPVSTTDQTAKTTIYYTPYIHNKIRLYDGTRWELFDFTERSIAVPATTNQMYDIFIYDNAGTLTLELTAWTNDTTRATDITRQDGVYVKSGSVTRRYLGSFRTTGVSGQTEDSNANRLLWNCHNKVLRRIYIFNGDAHTYTTGAWRAWNNDSTVRATIVVGDDIPLFANVMILVSFGSTVLSYVSLDLDGSAEGLCTVSTRVATTRFGASVLQALSIGYHYFQATEFGATGGDQDYFQGFVFYQG